VASPTGGKFQLFIDENPIHTISIPATGDWQHWITIDTTVSLSSGLHTFKIEAISNGWNFNFIEVEENLLTQVNSFDFKNSDLIVFPSPAQNFIEIRTNLNQIKYLF